jgi:hypothetical protein
MISSEGEELTKIFQVAEIRNPLAQSKHLGSRSITRKKEAQLLGICTTISGFPTGEKFFAQSL